MTEKKFREELTSNIELPFEIEDVEKIESNCGSTWINLYNGNIYSISIQPCTPETTE